MTTDTNPRTKKRIVFAALCIVLLAAGFIIFRPKPPLPPPPPIKPWGGDIPVVFRTQGGLLEVAGFDFKEPFYKSDPSWILGTTVSQIEVPVRYRYHIVLQREWKVIIRGQTCLVAAPEIEPILPVAIDTAQMQKKTEAGWARFNKADNLEQLERSITPELESRARSEKYVAQIREAARKTVAEFITAWLLRDQQWQDDPFHSVKVYFPDESPEPAPRPSISVEIKPLQ